MFWLCDKSRLLIATSFPRQTGETPIHFAAASAKEDVINLLISTKADESKRGGVSNSG